MKTILCRPLQIVWRLTNLFLLCLLSLGFAQIAQAELKVENARIRHGIGQRPSIVYAAIHNNGLEIRLNKITSPQFARIELHTHEVKNDIVRMRPVPFFTIAARATLYLQPRGRHIMLLEPHHNMNRKITLTLHYTQDGQKKTQNITVYSIMSPHKQKTHMPLARPLCDGDNDECHHYAPYDIRRHQHRHNE